MSCFVNNFCFIVLCLLSQYFFCKALNVETRCEHGSQKVFLVDNLLKRNEIKWLSGYLTKHRPWVLNQKDVFKQNSLDLRSNSTWVSPMSIEMFENTRIWKRLAEILKQLTGNDHFICYAAFTIAYRLDFIPVSKTGKPDYYRKT